MCSSQAEVGGDDSELEAKLRQGLSDYQKRNANKKKIKTFNTVMMKFPKVEAGFKACKSTFSQYAKGKDNTLNLADFEVCCKAMNFHVTQEMIRKVFNASDVDGSRSIDSKEFVLTICILYVMEEFPEDSGVTGEVKEAFELVTEAFIFLDENNDGSVSKSEVMMALNTASTPGSRGIVEKRFAEMDWDQNGNISFKEFLLGMEAWVGLDDDEDEE